jgi:Sep-tRNA:Cys-tRNA synthetase
MKNPYYGKIVINALMRGGIVPDSVREKLSEFCEIGYIMCFDCLKGRTSLCQKPDVASFLKDVASFFGGDCAEHTFGCRGAQFAVMRTIAVWQKEQKDYAPVIIVDPNCHYTTIVTAEMCDLEVLEAEHTGYPEYRVKPETYRDRIEEVKKRGRLPALIVATHSDPYYGNIEPVEEIAQIAKEYEIPYLVNAAYTAGVMPVNLREIGADFLTASAHKSMASLGPLGYVVTTYKWKDRLFSTSKTETSWSKRKFSNKITNIFGCAVGGIPLISSMLSFSEVKKRVGDWEEELSKINRFIDEMEIIEDVMLLGERPKRHHLLHFETQIFYEISKTHRKKGFFLADSLIKRGIVGLHRGMTKHIKLSVYGLTDSEIDRVRDAFFAIANS